MSASLHRFGLPTDYTIRRITLIYISHNINALFWLFVMYSDTLLVYFNEIKRNVLSHNINALFWLFVMYSDTLLVDFNEIKRNVIIGLAILSSIPSQGIDLCHSGTVTSRTKRTFVFVVITNNIFHFKIMLYSIKFIMYVNSPVAYFFLQLHLGLKSQHG